jgi:hypothetical protein
MAENGSFSRPGDNRDVDERRQTLDRGNSVIFEFHLSTKAIWVADEPSFMGGKWKEGVLQCVRSARQSAPP